MFLPTLSNVGCVLFLLAGSSIASNPRQTRSGNVRVRAASFEQDPATYDDACNIGFCSINGATIGGWGASDYTHVTNQAQLVAAVSVEATGVVLVQGNISGTGTVSVGSGKSIIGTPGSSLSGIALLLSKSSNVIIRNLKISAPPTSSEAITLENSRSIWIDHCELGPKSRINVTKGSDYVSITNNLFYDHTETTPAVTVGHSDNNSAQDKGKFHITFGRNYFKNVKSAVSFRFGTGHLFNSYYDNVENGINTRMGAEVLVEASVFAGTLKAVFSADSIETGFATLRDAVLGNSTNTAPAGDMTADSIPYPYDWYIYDKETVTSAVTRYAGQTLEFLV